jgi:hypothetical protein
MKQSLLLIMLVLIFGCSGQHKKLNKMIEKSTKVEVFVFEKSTGQNGIKAYESNDQSRIQEFKNYFTSKHAPSYQSGYNGKIVFTFGKKNLNVLFNLQPETTHIAYMIEYNLYTRQLSKEGVEFLKTVTTNLPMTPVEHHKELESE